MAAAALWYAKRGLPVIPLHEPLFDDTGHVCGCTCEAWQRANRDPGYICKTPGKHPRLKDWEGRATTDPDQIRRWWRAWPNANIGLAPGKAGLVILDADAYKETYDGDGLLSRADEETVTTLTGSGGVHLWYSQPDGAAYGNQTGELPAGIDIRGHGGMVVLPPSLHPSGRRYAFEAGYNPVDTAVRPLPDRLRAILDAAVVTKRTAAAVTLPDAAGEPPDLTHVAPGIVDRLHQTPAKGARSEADMAAVVGLCYAGLSDADILAVFAHYPIGRQGKFAEAGRPYLAHTIGKARAYVADHPRPEHAPGVEGVPVPFLIAAARVFVLSPELVTALQACGVRRVDPYRKTLDALLDLAVEAGTLTICPVGGLRTIAERAGCGVASVNRHLRILAGHAPGGACLLEINDGKSRGAWRISLKFVVQKWITSQLGGTYDTDPLLHDEKPGVFTVHKTDDAFQSYPVAYAMRRRVDPSPTVLAAGLGVGALVAIHFLTEHGPLTRAELAAAGMTAGGVAYVTRRLEWAGLVTATRDGPRAPNVYELAPDWQARLDDRRPHMTTFGLGQLRGWQFDNAAAAWADRQLGEHLRADRRPELEPRRRLRLLERRDQAHGRAVARRDALLSWGIDPQRSAADNVPKPKVLRIDRAEHYRAVWLAWDALHPLGDGQRYGILANRGFAKWEIKNALRARTQGPRVYAGVGDPLAAAAQLADLPDADRRRMMAYAGYTDGDLDRAAGGAA